MKDSYEAGWWAVLYSVVLMVPIVALTLLPEDIQFLLGAMCLFLFFGGVLALLVFWFVEDLVEEEQRRSKRRAERETRP